MIAYDDHQQARKYHPTHHKAAREERKAIAYALSLLTSMTDCINLKHEKRYMIRALDFVAETSIEDYHFSCLDFRDTFQRLFSPKRVEMPRASQEPVQS